MDADSSLDHARRWFDRASAVGFLPYEVVDPVPDESWVSGLGGGSHEMSLSITAHVAGASLTVDTTTANALPDRGESTRDWVVGVLQELVPEPVVLPLTVSCTFEARDVPVVVDGSPVTFRALVATTADGTCWEMVGRVGDATEIVVRGDGALRPLGLRRRGDLEILTSMWRSA